MVAATPDNANPIIHSTGAASRRATKRADELDFGDDETWERLGRDPLNGEIVMDSLEQLHEDSASEEIDREEIFGKLHSLFSFATPSTALDYAASAERTKTTATVTISKMDC